MGFPRQEYWSGLLFPFWHRDGTHVSGIGRCILYHRATWEVREEFIQGVRRGGKAFWVHSSWNINGTSAAQMVQPKAAQEEINPRTPSTSPLGKWRSPSNAGVPAPTPWSWEEHGAWAGHPHALHSRAGPVTCPHVMHFHFPRDKELQWGWGGGWEAEIKPVLLTEWCWVSSLKRSSHIGAEVDFILYDLLANLELIRSNICFRELRILRT